MEDSRSGGDAPAVDDDSRSDGGGGSAAADGGTPSPDGGSVTGTTPDADAADADDTDAGSDLTDRLAALRDATREMMRCERREQVAEIAAETAAEVLSTLMTVVSLYDRESGELRGAAAASGVVDSFDGTRPDDPVELADDDLAWEAFVSGAPQVVADYDGDAVGSKLALPLGDHGVLVVEAATADAFPGADVEFLKTLVAATEAALEAADREATILDRTERLRDRNDQLDRLRRVDAIVRDIGGTLVRATDREDIETAVCERLANVDRWAFAWIGERRVTDEGVHPRAFAGDEGYLEAVAAAAADGPPFADTPAERALRTGDPVVEGDVVAAPASDAWRTTTLDHGFRSVVAIPLVYEHREYGVLEVYGTEPDTFGEAGTEVLAELGDMIAYAINAVERERAVATGAGPEIELRVAAPEDPLVALAGAVGGELTVDGIVPESDGTYLAYATVTTEDDAVPEVERLREAGESVAGIERLRILSPEAGRFEVRLADAPVFDSVATGGGAVRGLTATGDGCTVRVELPPSADVRGFVEAFTAGHDAEVLAQRSTAGGDDVRAGFLDRLTDRQREVMRVAYHSGFFEWPRESTGEDIADTLGVSPPTVHKHIRAVERKLVGAVLESNAVTGD